MPKLVAPIERFATARVNRTLHGRSVYRDSNVPGHNVFRGWSTWAQNGHTGVGAGLDIMGQGWRTPVVAICDCTQTLWRNDATKLEVIYIEAPGVVAVYAHINARHEGTGKRWRKGETIGVVRGDLGDPHLHFELWLDGKAVAAPSPEKLRALMLAEFGAAETTPVQVITHGTDDVIAEYSMVENGNHIADQGKLYVADTEA